MSKREYYVITYDFNTREMQFPRDDDRFEKIDWYDQVIRNIDIVGREVIRHVREFKHERKKEGRHERLRK